MTTTNALSDLLSWYTHLSPDKLDKVSHFYAETVHFKDPFNELQGVNAIRALFIHMFSVTEQAHFVVLQRISEGNSAFVTWDFHFLLRGKQYRIHGGSHLIFNSEGKVELHRDYWDAAEELFQHLPLVGSPIRWLRHRFALPEV